MIELRLLGGLHVRASDGALSHDVISQPKRLALVSFLALEASDDWISRDRLLGIFWPDSTDERARGALRKALHSIRAAMGREAIVNRGEEYLRADPLRVVCDAREFQLAAAAGQHARALELYRGDLLPGFHLAEAHEFDEWLELQRVRLRSLARAAALRGLDELRAGEPSERVLRCTTQVGQLFPEDEEIVRRVMKILSRQGERTAALQVFDRLRVRLEHGYGLSPTEPTLELASRIRVDAAQGANQRERDTPPARVRLGPSARVVGPSAHAADLFDLVEHAPDILYRADNIGRFTLVNAAAVRVTGYSRDELTQLSFLDLVREDYHDGMLAFYIRQQEERVPVTFYEFPIRRKDGREIWIEQNVRLLLEEDEPAGVIGVARDITARWHTQEAQRNLALLDRATGLLNRRALTLLLEQKRRIAERNRSTFALLRVGIMDEGDNPAALAAAARALRRVLRDSDALARISPTTLAVLPADWERGSAAAMVRRVEIALRAACGGAAVPPGLGLQIEAVEFGPDNVLSAESLLDSACAQWSTRLAALPLVDVPAVHG